MATLVTVWLVTVLTGHAAEAQTRQAANEAQCRQVAAYYNAHPGPGYAICRSVTVPVR